MELARLAGPWQYRKFVRIADRFFRLLPWLWFGGIGGCLLVSVLGLGQRAVILVCCASIYPALFGWLGFNGVGILWTWLLAVRPARMCWWAWAFFVVWLAIGVVFTGGAVGVLVAVLKWALAG
jgi:hypothetical protein